MVLLLSSEKCPGEARGWIFESGCGWQARTRFQRSAGVDFPLDRPLKSEEVSKSWKRIVDFTRSKTSNPEKASEMRNRILANIDKYKASVSASPQVNKYLEAIENAKASAAQHSEFSFTEKDTILYNLSLGATSIQLPFVYENDPGFQVLPTFGVIPGTAAKRPFSLEDLVPSFSFERLLHGEQFLEVRKYPIPVAGTLHSECKLLDVIDKGKASIAIVATTSKDVATGEEVFYNETSLFLRGAGGFGGLPSRPDIGEATAVYSTPKRQPDVVLEEKTSSEQAALYRLNGDRNPLHIDPKVSKAAGFEVPILHGLCTFGIAAKHIIMSFGQIKSIKVRFAGTVIPGQTLLTEMWREGSTVLFQVRIKESSHLCISSSAVKLWPEPTGRL
jgi:multifunctional beta-oxidation protein